ncbi:MAG: hypothetical protein A2Z37_16150 [Chloroflexi bacterium RBG_19FT_COMBO_62_14]|nr:MAG: hypothetical protein A2Z37_16150 [Chloroflexi bacterium RBG_19FT_COMBO_62_14]
MIPLTFRDFQIIVAGVLLLLGCIYIIIGTIVLISRGYSSEVKALAAQTAQLGQKGMAQEVSGLVSSAAELVASINQLIRTGTGVGAFLICLGLLMLGAGYWVVQQISWTVA